MATRQEPLFSSPGPDDEPEPPVSEAPQPEVGNTLALRDAPHLSPAVQSAAVAAAAGAKASIEARFLMALQRPRNIEEVHKRVLAMCEDPWFAEAALYKKPIGGGKFAEGISIRFAEEYVREATNFHIDPVVTWDDDERRMLTVAVTDLDRNNTIPVPVVVEKYVERFATEGREVLGSRLNTKGKRIYRVRATDDEVGLKQANYVSKAFRTGVERLIDFAFKAKAIATVKATMQQEAKREATKGGNQNIDRLVGLFTEQGVRLQDLEAYLGHAAKDMTPDEYQNLRAIGKAIEDEETTWEQVMAQAPKAPAQKRAPVKPGGY